MAGTAPVRLAWACCIGLTQFVWQQNFIGLLGPAPDGQGPVGTADVGRIAAGVRPAWCLWWAPCSCGGWWARSYSLPARLAQLRLASGNPWRSILATTKPDSEAYNHAPTPCRPGSALAIVITFFVIVFLTGNRTWPGRHHGRSPQYRPHGR